MDLTAMEALHEDLIYIVECIVEDFTGGAKHELSSIIDRVKSVPADAMWGKSAIVAELESGLVMLQVRGEYQVYFVNLRRKVRNTIERMRGRNNLYNYAAPYAPKSYFRRRCVLANTPRSDEGSA